MDFLSIPCVMNFGSVNTKMFKRIITSKKISCYKTYITTAAPVFKEPVTLTKKTDSITDLFVL